ncbi:CrcB family protein [Solibacillus sp. FSL W8-0474]|uniref:fluoride efflux transporter FluC n=1 Tax=Solibacillus sp. FSL W8-0474 TaxID=2975336 RepID=UPI0030F9462B
MIYFLVGTAGAIGAVLRYVIGILFFTNSSFPITTLIVNLIGCFLLAWFPTSLFKRLSVSPMIRTAVSTGFIGSFTTFSAVSVETITMFQTGNVLLAAFYVFLSISGGLLMSRLGYQRSRE